MARNDTQLSWKEALKRNVRAWRTIGRCQPKLFGTAVLPAVFDGLGPYVTIYLSARIIEELAGERNPGRLTFLVAVCLIASAAVLFGRGAFKRWAQVEKTCFYEGEEKIYMDKAASMEFALIDRQQTYDLYSQIMQNRQWASYGLYRDAYYLSDLLRALLQIAGGLGLSVTLFLAKVPSSSDLAFLNSPLAAAACLGLLLLIAVAAPALKNKAEGYYWVRYAEMARLGNRQFGYFFSASVDRKRYADMRMYCQNDNLLGPLWENCDSFMPGSAIAELAKGRMGLLAGLSRTLSAVLTGAVYLFVCLKAWAGAFGVGMVTQYVGAITNLFLGVSEFLELCGTLRANASFLDTTFAYLDLPNEMYQGSLTTEKRSDRQYQVEFRDVSFKYPGSETWALRHVNMTFQVGSRLAVVGQNGSGKTTFIKLLCRLYDPTEGEILLNGIDIRKYRYEDYIQIFSVVFQDFQLFALPLGENVAGRTDYDREQVWNCLKKAGFEERMSRMTKGLDTYLYKDLDKEGVEISGGEAQKIAIARALYKEAPFLILDEPTAALDPIAEAEIYGKFNEIATDKTTVYISHRLSSCKFCDEIAVFDQGAVVQEGSHEELLSDEDGKYYELWHAQAQYYTEEAVRVLLG
ncbi:MAG: ABC transporter ATP-binding protein/permease [Lachnospiraceae bacterium]|nr:ABC transporter ATP-binding protein/permease [Lachnospiraceae bacterium]